MERDDFQSEQDLASANPHRRPWQGKPPSLTSMQRPQWENRAVANLTLAGTLAEYCPPETVGYACWL